MSEQTGIRFREIRVKVERLINETPQLDDFRSILLYLREHDGGNEWIGELGDFVAHASKKEKGIVSDHLRLWYASIIVGTAQLRRALTDDLNRSLRSEQIRLRSLDLTRGEARSTGVSLKRARQIGKSLAVRLVEARDYNYKFEPSLSEQELPVLRVLMKNVLKPAFDDSRVTRELASALRVAGLIKESKTAKVIAKRDDIAKFTLVLLHGTRLSLTGTSAILQGGVGEKGNLAVFAVFPVHYQGPPTDVCFEVFRSDLSAQRACVPELHTHTRWSCPVEIGSHGLIVPLR